MKKHEAAATLGRLGGHARAKALTADERRAIATNAIRARWTRLKKIYGPGAVAQAVLAQVEEHERDAQRALALQLIDVGYKGLATTLHPRKGESRAVLAARLTAVRDRLKQHVERERQR